MTLNLLTVSVFCAVFIIGLLLIAIAAERRFIPERWSTSTIVYVLSIGIAASSTSLSAINYAASTKFGYFVYYFGGAILFLLGGLLLKHIYHLTRRFHFENLFDLLAFRFRKPWIGAVISLFGIITILPIIANQLALLTTTVTLLQTEGKTEASPLSSQLMTTFLFCISITFLNFILSTYRLDRRHRNNGLIVITAISSLLGLAALYSVATLAIGGSFGNVGTFVTWIESEQATQALKTAPSFSLKSVLLLSLASALCLPHIFHFSFGEQPRQKPFNKSFWAFPLLLLIFSLPTLPIAAAGNHLFEQQLALNYLVLIPIYLDEPLISFIVLAAQISAYYCVAVVLCLVATTILINYLILPVFKPTKTKNLHIWMRTTRRSVGSLVMLAAWLLANVVSDILTLHSFLIAAIGLLVQFLPGIIATFYFPRASSWGFVIGLLSGSCCYLSLTFISFPLWLATTSTLVTIIENAVPISLLLNAICIAVFSLLLKSDKKDTLAANLTTLSDNTFRNNPQLAQQSARDFITALVPMIGQEQANTQVQKALTELKFNEAEQRPFALIQLRNTLEKNLSRLLGPSITQNTITQVLPYSLSSNSLPNRKAEEKMEQLESQFTGIAGEIERLRRFHRQTLVRLPVGACSINNKDEIVLWNRHLEDLSGLATIDTEGAKLLQLPEPWQQLITGFLADKEASTSKVTATINNTQRWLTLHKDKVNLELKTHAMEDKLIVIEDITELKMLEDELIHNERLASVGRLAAGVAHEIGNPVTGIACLAQNLKLDSNDPEVLSTSAEIISQTRRISAIMHALVSFSHGGKAETTRKNDPVQLSQCIQAAITLIRLDSMAVQVNFEFAPKHDITIDGDEQRLHQIFVNLLTNARDASPENATIWIDVNQQDTLTTISITDEGSGIPNDIQEKVFEPFFTTKEVGKGTGLGLALVHSIVEDHAGSISIESPLKHNKGTQFIIKLPNKNTVAPFSR